MAPTMSDSDDDASEVQLDEETKQFMYDRLAENLRHTPVNDCVHDLVDEMQTHHEQEYNVPTIVLVDAAYDVAADAMQALTDSYARDIAAQIDGGDR